MQALVDGAAGYKVSAKDGTTGRLTVQAFDFAVSSRSPEVCCLNFLAGTKRDKPHF